MAHALLPDPKALTLDTIAVKEGMITFHIRTTAEVAVCPECKTHSERVHSRYQRTLQDLPWQGNTVCFLLTVRRFFCGNVDCKRKIFAEAPVSVARRYRRKTSRLDDLLLQLVWKVGGESAAAIARLIGLLLSPDAALYRIKKSAQNTIKESPEILGVDDFAFRKGHTYGTILVDLKTSTPVDLLPDREKATVEKWLKDHPGAKIVSRDRSAGYAEAIRVGAPDAIHVADRFHLLKNLMEVLEKQLSKESKAIHDSLLPKEASWEDPGPVPLSRHQQQRKEVTRQKRFDLWQKAHELFGLGHAKKEVARQMGISVRTVRTYLRAAAFPERQSYPSVSGPLDPYKPFLIKRWEEGCHNALELFREIKAQGFSGGATSVRNFVQPYRDPNLPPAVLHAKRSIPAPSSLAWLLVLPDKNSPKQKELVDKLCAALPILPKCRDLVLSFQDIMRRRAKDELDDWLDRAKASELPAFVTFVRGIRSDYAAVKAAFTLEWSNGPVEGHVNRLKFIKRQGYGRASFDLLKRRVLPLPA